MAPVEGVTEDGHDPILRRPADDQPFAALAFKIMSDPYVGHLTYIRVYSGVLKSGDFVYNASKRSRERIGPVSYTHLASADSARRTHGGHDPETGISNSTDDLAAAVSGWKRTARKTHLNN